MSKFSNELELLFEVSQITPSQKRISEIFHDGIDETLLLDLAIAHGVLPLVYEVLLAIKEIKSAPAIKDAAVKIAKSNFFITAQLLQLCYKLKTYHDIELLSIKGPALAQHAYGEIRLRPFSDLDILVLPGDLLKVSEVILEMGYCCEHSLEALRNPYILEHFSDISFVHPETGLVIELHWKLFAFSSAIFGDTPTLFKHSSSLSLQGLKLRILDHEEEFLYLCIHAAKHRFERIEWINDLNRLFDKYHHIYDWKRLYALATEEKVLKIYLLSLRLLQELYLQKMPDEETKRLLKKSSLNKQFQEVMEQYTKYYILRPKKRGIRWMEFFFVLKLDDTIFQQLHRIKKLFFPLYIDDILSLGRADNKLGISYYIIRFKRYIHRHLLS